jgi:hypothetical protein
MRAAGSGASDTNEPGRSVQQQDLQLHQRSAALLATALLAADKALRKTYGEVLQQEKIDAILDKLSEGGYQSLSEEEKKVLFQESKKLR